MTDQDIAGLGPAFAAFLRRFRDCFRQDRTAAHFGGYCRELLSDLPRKSVEPIALACRTAVRTLQEFLTTANWDHERARDTLQRHLAEVIGGLPPDRSARLGSSTRPAASSRGIRPPACKGSTSAASASPTTASSPSTSASPADGS